MNVPWYTSVLHVRGTPPFGGRYDTRSKALKTKGFGGNRICSFRYHQVSVGIYRIGSSSIQVDIYII